MGSRRMGEAAVLVSGDPLLGRKAVAEVRLDEALASIDEAQRHIDRAGAALASVRGMAAECRELGTLYEKVKTSSYAVSNRARRLRSAGRLLIDREPDAYELRAAGRDGRS